MEGIQPCQVIPGLVKKCLHSDTITYLFTQVTGQPASDPLLNTIRARAMPEVEKAWLETGLSGEELQQISEMMDTDWWAACDKAVGQFQQMMAPVLKRTAKQPVGTTTNDEAAVAVALILLTVETSDPAAQWVASQSLTHFAYLAACLEPKQIEDARIGLNTPLGQTLLHVWCQTKSIFSLALLPKMTPTPVDEKRIEKAEELAELSVNWPMLDTAFNQLAQRGGRDIQKLRDEVQPQLTKAFKIVWQNSSLTTAQMDEVLAIATSDWWFPFMQVGIDLKIQNPDLPDHQWKQLAISMFGEETLAKATAFDNNPVSKLLIGVMRKLSRKMVQVLLQQIRG